MRLNTFRWCSKGLCTMIAGTGKEENRNNSYNGQRASFAQPSGLCLTKPQSRAGHGDPSLYIADSESSSIRRMFLDSMGKYRVVNVAGGSPDPTVECFLFLYIYTRNNIITKIIIILKTIYLILIYV